MILVIGVGNSLRRDDGVGLAGAEVVAAELAAQGVAHRLILCQQLSPELAVDLSEPEIDDVLLVDASVAADGIIFGPLDAGADHASAGADEHGDNAVESERALANSHNVAPAALLAYTSLLRDNPPRAWVIQLPVFDLDHGEGFSEPARAALDSLASRCAELIRTVQSTPR